MPIDNINNTVNPQLPGRDSLTDQQNAIAVREHPPLWGMILSFLVLFLFLAFVGWRLFLAQQGNLRVGLPAPAFELISTAGESYSKDSLQGKVVVLNFWASWCMPCEEEAAILQSAWERYRSNDEVIFLGINYADTPSGMEEFITSNQITYPNGVDTGTIIARAYRIRGVPETFVIAPDGRISMIQIGPFRSLDEITEHIDGLFQQ